MSNLNLLSNRLTSPGINLDLSNEGLASLSASSLTDSVSKLSQTVRHRSSTGRTFEVTNTNSTGVGSFNQAIEEANANPGHDLIIFSGKVFKDKIPDKILVRDTPPIQFQTPSIEDDVTIVGPGADLLALSGGKNYGSVLTVLEGVTAKISGLKIIEGYGFQYSIAGGGITNFGDLTLDKVIIAENNGASVANGIANYGNLTLNRTTVTNNSSDIYENAWTGGIYNEGVASIINSVISNNVGLTGGIWNGGGGGVYLTTFGTLTIENTTIFNNQGINWGGIHNDLADVTIINSLIKGNSGFQGGGVSAYGSLGENGSNLGSLTISHSKILNNFAAGDGGGISNGTGSKLLLSHTNIEGNSATQGGGISNQGTLTVDHGTVIKNTAEQGGGIYNQGTLTIEYSKIEMNSAVLIGGGIFNFGVFNIFEPNFSSLMIRKSVINNNSADVGGGIYNYGGVLTISDSTLRRNSANKAGGIYNIGYYEVYEDEFERVVYETPAILALINTTITQNQALTGSGGGVFNESLQGIWGQLSTVTVKCSTIKKNIAALSGPDVYGEFVSEGYNTIGDASGSLGFVDGVNNDKVG